MADLTIITCTADRPFAFSLCEKWMARQTFRGSIKWIVADGGTEPARCTLGQQHLVLGPEPDPLKNFHRNMVAALEQVESPRIAFVEDDDWYAADWLETVHCCLDHGDIAGEVPARYYNIASRRYREHTNGGHASLCQTAIRVGLVWPFIEAIRVITGPFIDRILWDEIARGRRRRLERSRRVVGMKGLPGRGGLGLGHSTHHFGDALDQDGSLLRKWIGNDTLQYHEAMNRSKSYLPDPARSISQTIEDERAGRRPLHMPMTAAE